jgi:hypothetical protein
LRDTVVVDLDGTLANIDHRTHLVKKEKPEWDAFFAACVDDTPNEWCVSLITAMHNSFKKILIVTARKKTVEKETKAWLKKLWSPLGGPDLIMLRDADDRTPDDELKRKWLHSYGKERILFVVDDRQRVVNMWRSEGLVCLQCYQWDEYKKPLARQGKREG